MKKSIKILLLIILSILTLSLILYIKLQPLRELNNFPPYKATSNFTRSTINYDKTKKTVLIMADINGTEMFDMISPYYLFNATGKANVFIVAQKIYPIIMNKGPFIVPHFTYNEIDSMKIHPDVIVIPYMNHETTRNEKTNWIKKHYNESVIILSICDGAKTAAATGLYDGKLLTAHATDYKNIKKDFTKPRWVQGLTYTKDGNLYSTAGVSNATDGSLAVINELFGREVMLSVLKSVNYPHQEIQKKHSSIAINKSAILSALNKMLFKNNKKLGVLLQDGINEFELAAIFDTYHRTLPSSMQAYIINKNSVTSHFGLTLLPTDRIGMSEIDELEIINPEVLTKSDSLQLKNTSLISHFNKEKKYIIEECFDKIEDQNGANFRNLVKLSLDYN